METVLLETKESIYEILRDNPQGLTLNSLSSSTGLHRHTVRKYVQILLAEQKVKIRTIGRAKLCYAE